MALYSYREFTPSIGQHCFIAPSSELIGRIEIGDHSNLWFNTVVRGDVNKVVIGRNCNVQDLSMLHVTEEHSLFIGDNVSIGHHVVLHGCTIKDSCLIGMGAIILDGAIIEENSVVAAGSIVPPGKSYPPGSLIMGPSAKALRELRPEEKLLYANHYKSYLTTKSEYLDSSLFKKLS